ncbi:phosphoglycerate dehydrogenase [Aliarcobacter butzleri]|uniref:phosphoglycerate dehydrogenase n=1 Tax=Aliarcobacter butzleri TaxID=28197 RepID=UPI0021B15ABE|nr:phosphoglycerate dehydrogenase [Aliarcobacter butzleri]MCT7590800.1 phosphoglycerate dehydrogenase [Aliarcobacter butzleri]
MINNLTLGITTVAFSKNQFLVDKVKNLGFKKIYINEKYKRFTQEELIEFLFKCDIAIIGLDKIDEYVLSKIQNLKVISKYGVGLDNIDFNICKKYNIEVLHTQGVNKRSVSELTLGCILSLLRNIYTSSNFLKQNIWEKNGGTQLSNKTIGIIGVGNIGKDLVDLIQAFKCKILVNDIIEQKDYYKKYNLIETSKETIYKSADVITIHTPLNESTKYMINKESLSLMKPNVIIINTARGGIINQDDLKWALKNNIIAGAAIDAYEIEPPEDLELLNLPNLINTPHIGGNAIEAVNAMGDSAIDNILNWIKNGNNR